MSRWVRLALRRSASRVHKTQVPWLVSAVPWVVQVPYFATAPESGRRDTVGRAAG